MQLKPLTDVDISLMRKALIRGAIGITFFSIFPIAVCLILFAGGGRIGLIEIITILISTAPCLMGGYFLHLGRMDLTEGVSLVETGIVTPVVSSSKYGPHTSIGGHKFGIPMDIKAFIENPPLLGQLAIVEFLPKSGRTLRAVSALPPRMRS